MARVGRRRHRAPWPLAALPACSPPSVPLPLCEGSSAPHPAHLPAPLPPTQANKNVLVKGQVGLQGAAAAAVFKSWWQPSFTLGASAAVDFATGKRRFGLTAAVETFKNIRWAVGE